MGQREVALRLVRSVYEDMRKAAEALDNDCHRYFNSHQGFAELCSQPNKVAIVENLQQRITQLLKATTEQEWPAKEALQQQLTDTFTIILNNLSQPLDEAWPSIQQLSLIHPIWQLKEVLKTREQAYIAWQADPMLDQRPEVKPTSLTPPTEAPPLPEFVSALIFEKLENLDELLSLSALDKDYKERSKKFLGTFLGTPQGAQLILNTLEKLIETAEKSKQQIFASSRGRGRAPSEIHKKIEQQTLASVQKIKAISDYLNQIGVVEMWRANTDSMSQLAHAITTNDVKTVDVSKVEEILVKQSEGKMWPCVKNSLMQTLFNLGFANGQPLDQLHGKYHAPNNYNHYINLKSLDFKQYTTKKRSVLLSRSWNYADLRNASLQGLLISPIEMNYADLQDANLEYTSFVNKGGNNPCDLNNANLQGANLRYATFDQALLKNTDLRGAVLQGAVFKDSDLSNVNLQDTDLRNAEFYNVKNPKLAYQQKINSAATLKELSQTFTQLSKEKSNGNSWLPEYEDTYKSLRQKVQELAQLPRPADPFVAEVIQQSPPNNPVSFWKKESKVTRATFNKLAEIVSHTQWQAEAGSKLVTGKIDGVGCQVPSVIATVLNRMGSAQSMGVKESHETLQDVYQLALASYENCRTQNHPNQYGYENILACLETLHPKLAVAHQEAVAENAESTAAHNIS